MLLLSGYYFYIIIRIKWKLIKTIVLMGLLSKSIRPTPGFLLFWVNWMTQGSSGPNPLTQPLNRVSGDPSPSFFCPNQTLIFHAKTNKNRKPVCFKFNPNFPFLSMYIWIMNYKLNRDIIHHK